MLIYMKNRLNRPFVLILYGPTGVGKTDVALSIALSIPAEIINMDMGQFYTPLSIGTAKPDWKNSPIPHHLFDVIDTPINYTVAEYRALLYKTVHEVIERGNLPILVGGSGFYLHSLLFPPHDSFPDIDITPFYSDGTDLWHELYAIDPERAMNIDKADTYRIRRALGIWHATGKLPSSYAPEYNPGVDFLLLFLERDRQELKQRIDDRVVEMFEAGWIAESKKLIGTPWQQFIENKNLIGYNEIFDYLAHNEKAYNNLKELIDIKNQLYAQHNPGVGFKFISLERDRLVEAVKAIGRPWQEVFEKKKLIGYSAIVGYSEAVDYISQNKKAYDSMIELIRIKTRQYAKRQFTFWRKLEREIKQKSGYTGMYVGCLETVNLTNLNINLYINDLLKRLTLLLGKKI